MGTVRYQRRHRLWLGGCCVIVAALALGGVGLATGRPGSVLARSIIGSNPVHQIWPPDPDPTTVPTTTPTPGEQPPNQPPPKQYRPPPAPPQPVAPARNPTEAVNAAAAAGRARGERIGVAVLDRQTGVLYGAGDVDGQFASASVMKVFIATRLLVEGRADDPAVEAQMWQMIVASDDNAARTLYHQVGTESLIPWVAARYGISGLAPANVPNYWGLTRITARAVVRFYAAAGNDPAVAPWLLRAMANAQPTAADGFHQFFGIPSAASSWRVKQGWMCCLESLTRMHSTGYVGSDRYAVALLTEGSTSVYGNDGAQTLTLMARALLPGGSIPPAAGPPPTTAPPPPTSTPTPTATPSPTPAPTQPPTPQPTQTPTAGPARGPRPADPRYGSAEEASWRTGRRPTSPT